MAATIANGDGPVSDTSHHGAAPNDVARVDEPSHRRMSFAYDDSFDAEWHPRLPELAAAANAVSLMMPHAEPYVARAVRRGVSQLRDSAATDGDSTTDRTDWDAADEYVRQELEHHRQHQRFNEIVMAHFPSVARFDRVLRWTFERLGNRSDHFALAFAAGFETIAYAGARWTNQRLRRLFDDADPVASTLFLWHLAEEVEHKNVAFDVTRAVGVGFMKRLLGLVAAAVLLATFAFAGTWTLLIAQRRVFSPTAHLRLVGWSLSFVFEAMPAMAVSLLPKHHPSSLSDPTWFARWLSGYDPESETIPLWNS